MTGVLSLGPRGGGVSSYGFSRKPSSKMLLLRDKDKDKDRYFNPFVCCRYYLARRRVAMMLLVGLALLVFIWGSLNVSKESSSPDIKGPSGGSIHYMENNGRGAPPSLRRPHAAGADSSDQQADNDTGEINDSTRTPISYRQTTEVSDGSSDHPCHEFSFPPPPPPGGKRRGPRPCPVCYLPAEQARARMPSSPSVSPVLYNLTYVVDENPLKTEPLGGSEFGGYPSLQERNDSYDIRESMKVHCGFVKGSKPGLHTGFDIDEADLRELEQFHDVIVASAIFGNYDLIQQPKNISEAAMKDVPFYMFIDEETEAYMKNVSILDKSMKVGLWRIIVVHNIPYTDPRRNGKVPKLLLHRIFPNVRYSIWIDGKLRLVEDPYKVLERFLWSQNASFAISRHYRRFDVFVEAEANKAAGKYDNSSIDYQIDLYKSEGLTPYTRAKLPITSDVPEGCVIIREHIPITNLFTCLWFNEVDRFTARDQLSFSTVRDRIMKTIDWSISMFLDCERRNFVFQNYHKEILDHLPPPIVRGPPVMRRYGSAGRYPVRSSSRRGKDRRYSARHHRKAVAGDRFKQAIL
ncbi:probable hexosyltransferase MUCI70 [Mercurialis annua]|uniref:probable hexosyltransferase MUCI70 n=1 Tax=Mercurialis annua TaxID=3986 RepID=UPI00215FECD3|nr:probable hexosyltransferase MUCI70 [Mercurialis annua]